MGSQGSSVPSKCVTCGREIRINWSRWRVQRERQCLDCWGTDQATCPFCQGVWTVRGLLGHKPRCDQNPNKK